MSLDQRRLDHPPPYPQSLNPSSSLKLPPLPTGDTPDRAVQLPPIDQLTPKPASNLDLDNVTRPASFPLHTPTGTVLQPLNISSVPFKASESSARSTEPNSGAMSLDEPSRKRDHSVSMDDPDDRMAAEALCGLGKVTSARSERSASGYETPLQYYPMGTEHIHPPSSQAEEPLLSLLTSSHPWLAGTINHSLSAYSSTKSHSPRFIQYGADLVERKIGSPMANTVGSVGRKTGVEGSLRRYLGARRPSELERIDPEILSGEMSDQRPGTSSNGDEMDVEQRQLKRTASGHTSIDTLPVYDDNRSPAYEPRDLVVATADRGDAHAQRQKILPVARSWSTQLMISTSGLGAALNEASLRSLKFCLTILRSANTHVTNLMEALKKLLSDFNARGSSNQSMEEGRLDGDMQIDLASTQRSSASIAERIEKLNTEIWQTLKNVVNTVSRHTGGALPENASVVVRWQLMSVPRRWQRAVSSSRPPQASENGSAPAEPEAVGSAHRMLAFAIEGIDMMEQVSGVVDSTITSAESWLESMGKKKKAEELPADTTAIAEEDQQESSGDVTMTDTHDDVNTDGDKEMAVDAST